MFFFSPHLDQSSFPLKCQFTNDFKIFSRGGSESADTAVCFVFVFVSADIGREVRSEGSSLDHATLSAMNSWNLIA